MEIVNQMKTYGEVISDETIVEKIFISMPEKYKLYKPIVAVLENTKYFSTMSVKRVDGFN